ncbi:hypothetical protein RFI_37686, partial [Reticulomyxa filosa]
KCCADEVIVKIFFFVYCLKDYKKGKKRTIDEKNGIIKEKKWEEKKWEEKKWEEKKCSNKKKKVILKRKRKKKE